MPTKKTTPENRPNPTGITRETASRLNPIIGADAGETLFNAADLIADIGHLASNAEIGSDGAPLNLDRVFLITDCIRSALLYEGRMIAEGGKSDGD